MSEVCSRFETAGVPYGPVDCSQYSHFTRCLPPNSRLIVVDAKEMTSSLLYKSDIYNPLPVDNVIPPVNNICLLLHDNHYLPLISLSAWFGRLYYCVPCKVAYKDKSRHICIPDKKCHMCQEKECISKPSFTVCCKHCFLELFATVLVIVLIEKTVCVNKLSRATLAVVGSRVTWRTTIATAVTAAIVQKL